MGCNSSYIIDIQEMRQAGGLSSDKAPLEDGGGVLGRGMERDGMLS